MQVELFSDHDEEFARVIHERNVELNSIAIKEVGRAAQNMAQEQRVGAPTIGLGHARPRLSLKKSISHIPTVSHSENK